MASSRGSALWRRRVGGVALLPLSDRCTLGGSLRAVHLRISSRRRDAQRRLGEAQLCRLLLLLVPLLLAQRGVRWLHARRLLVVVVQQWRRRRRHGRRCRCIS